MWGTTQDLDRRIEEHGDLIAGMTSRFGLPLHVVFTEVLRSNANAFKEAVGSRYSNSVIAFAVKSNPCRGAVRAASALGLGADVASEHELRLALEEGIDAERIVCNGNAKSAEYLKQAVEAGARIAVDNRDELDLLEQIVHTRSAAAQILIRFRGMPLSGLTSDDQTTAADWTKFGFHIGEASDLFRRLTSSERLRFHGISAHIGTQIADPRGYELLLGHLFRLAERSMDIGLPVDCIDIGGGFPVSFLTEAEWEAFTSRLLHRIRGRGSIVDAVTWNDLPMGYAHMELDEGEPVWVGKSYWAPYPASRMLAHLLDHRFEDGSTTVDRLDALGRPTLIVEPGRSLMATAGVTLTEVTGMKSVLGHPVVSLDLGINNHGTNLISPDIFPAVVWPRQPDDQGIDAFLAGRLCFSGDMISKAKIRLNRPPRRGDRFILYYTGAYSADHFASNSCGFPRPAKIALRPGGTAELWRPRESFRDVFGAPEDDLVIDAG